MPENQNEDCTACGYEHGRNSDCERCLLIRRAADAEKAEAYWRSKCDRMKRVCQSAENWLASLYPHDDLNKCPFLPTSHCHHDLVDATRAYQQGRVAVQCNTAIRTTAWTKADQRPAGAS